MIRTIRRDTPRGALVALAQRPLARAILILAATLAAICLPAVASAQSTGDVLAEAGLYLQATANPGLPGPVTGAINLNTFLGANRFYNAGFTGTNAVIANIEAGYIWNGHETLSHVTYIPTSGAAGEVDRHATWVGSILAGRPGGANPGDYQSGMAPNATLASGAIATSWPSDSAYPRYTTAFYLNFFGLSTFAPYRAAFITGVPTGTGSRPADVINSSWTGQAEPAGNDTLSGTLDALISANPRTLLTWAAGNSITGAENPNKVPSAGSAYNNLTVAALGPTGGAYNQPSFFTNSGPNLYYDPINGFIPGVRQVVDIAAPGEDHSAAYYGGLTGGNGPFVAGPPNGPSGGPNYYTRGIRGTSFATPTVAGGAALLYDAAYALLAATPDARDSRVVKAVLMNSADKTLNWNNGQTANPNGLGGVFTTRGLDDRVGAGRMNLNRAFDQFLSGTTDVLGTAQGALGNVGKIGWDFGQVAQGTTNDYLITSPLQAGEIFTATLTWFRDRLLTSETSYSEASFDNLDLELWSTLAGSPASLISASNSTYNNTEHFNFTVPTTGQYMLRVRWFSEVFDIVGDTNIEQYGLAWSASVPEPSVAILALLAICAPALTRGRVSPRRAKSKK
jgi:hypothetical protein